MSVNIPRALGGLTMIVAGVAGLATAYKNYLNSGVVDVVEVVEKPVEVVKKYDHTEELPVVPPEAPVESDPMVDTIKEPDPIVEALVEKTEVRPGYMDASLVDALLDIKPQPKPSTPAKPVAPKEEEQPKETPCVGKLMSPADIAEHQRIADLMYARAKTNNWDMLFPTVTKQGITWRASEVEIPSGITLSMVLFTKEKRPILFCRGNLILDTLSHQSPTMDRRKESILKSVTLPGNFPEYSTPIGLGTTVKMHSYIKKNRAYFGIPLKLVLTDGDPRMDASLMITTTNGQTIPSIERIIPLAQRATHGLCIAARASGLLGMHNITLDGA